MNDNELDTMLREHGTTWREGHLHRPAIDWAQVTESNRRPRAWLGLLAITATAAAVALPLVFLGGGKPAAEPNPATQKPLPLGVAQQGAPAGFFGIAPPSISGPGGAVAYVVKSGYEASNPPHRRAAAIGVTADGLTAYAAYPRSSCTTYVEKLVMRLHYKGTGEFMTNLDSATVPGVVARTAMAVSPDGTKLAYSTDEAKDPRTGRCVTTATTVDVLDLETKHVTTITGYQGDAIESLVWSPDSRHLAFEVIAGDPTTSAGRYHHEHGAYVIDTAAAQARLRATDIITSLYAARSGDGLYAPLLYWRDRLAVILDGALRTVQDDGRLGVAQLTGLPAEVMSASVDPTGQHILMVAGPYATAATGSGATISMPYSDHKEITTGTTYRWDRGLVTKVEDKWLDPAW